MEHESVTIKRKRGRMGDTGRGAERERIYIAGEPCMKREVIEKRQGAQGKQKEMEGQLKGKGKKH